MDLLRYQFVGVNELRKNLTKLLSDLRQEGGEVVITQQGKPTAVLLDVEKYLEVQDALREFSNPAYLAKLLDAKRQIRAGEGIPADEVFRQKGL